MSVTLQQYFETMAPFLRGEASAEMVLEKLGDSPSPVRRLALYQRLIVADIAQVINRMYAEFKTAYDQVRPGKWRNIIGTYARKYPPTVWQINQVGKFFPEFVTAEREADPELPYYFEEIADYCWTRYLAASAVDKPDSDDIMDHTVFVRQYTSTVPQFMMRAHENPTAELPQEGVTLCVLYRSLLTNKVHTLFPTIPGLLAIARRTNTSPELQAQFTQVTKETVDTAEAELVKLGVLRPLGPAGG